MLLKFFIIIFSLAIHENQLKLKKNKPIQQQITDSFETSNSQNQFHIDLCQALVGANIPFFKLQSLPFRSFLQKYTNKSIPDESTLRKKYLQVCFDSTIVKIRQKIGEHYIYIMVDETTDARGLYICNLLVGILHQEIDPTPFLIACKVLPKTNYDTVSRFINDNLMNFFLQNSEYQYKVLLLVTDAAPYMIKTGQALNTFYPNMIHVTCVAHGLNRVLEKVREIFPEVNKLVNNGKKILLKSPHRVEIYKNIMECELPPEPVITRWGTWLEAALFYAENFNKFKMFINALDEDVQTIKKLKRVITSASIISDLTFIKSHLSTFPQALTQLETRNLSLNKQIEIFETIGESLKKINNEKGQIMAHKFNSVVEKNTGYALIKKYNDCINGTKNMNVEQQPAIVACYKMSPITSVEVERTFSKLKDILSDRRHNFSANNFEMYNIVNFNSIKK